MPFIKRSLLIGTVLFAGILLFAASRPASFSVERSIIIRATPEKIYPLINDLRNFPLWSPYENIDPAMKRQFSGAASGKGAIYEWDGNNQVGTGRMEIVESRPYSRIVIKLDYAQPVEAHNTAEFTLQPVADGTRVSWRMVGPAPLLSRVMSLFYSMDRMIGPQFDQGLANLRRLTD